MEEKSLEEFQDWIKENLENDQVNVIHCLGLEETINEEE